MKNLLIILLLLLTVACKEECHTSDEPRFLWPELPVRVNLVQFDTDEEQEAFYEAIDLINENLLTEVYEIVDRNSQVKVRFFDEIEDSIYGRIRQVEDHVNVIVLSGMSYELTLQVMAHELIHAIGMGHTEDGLMYCYTEETEKRDIDWRIDFSPVIEWFARFYL